MQTSFTTAKGTAIQGAAEETKMAMIEIDTSEMVKVRDTQKAIMVEIGFGSKARQVWLPASQVRVRFDLMASDDAKSGGMVGIDSMLAADWLVREKALPVKEA